MIPILLILLTVIGCEKEKIAELPDNISMLRPVPDLVDSLRVYFPEGVNTYMVYPDLFSHAYQDNIVLKKESKVYITFIDEGADNRNTLCWYAYTQNISNPLKASDVAGKLVFPNISKLDQGGLLQPGFTVQIGTDAFPAGTVIGISLVQNGWADGTIKYSNPTFYTDYGLNARGMRQHVMFKDSYFNYILFSFEDEEFDIEQQNCDKDYNDVTFAVTDNLEGLEATSFDLSKVVSLTSLKKIN